MAKYNNNNTNKKPPQPPKQPDERGSFYLESHIKIFDPITNEVIVRKR